MAKEKGKKTDAGSSQRKSIHVNGKLTNEASKIVEKRFAESQKAFKPLVERIDASRRLTQEDLAFRVNTRD